MPRFLLLLALAAGAITATTAAWSADRAAETQSRLLKDIQYLASDELEGRGVGLKGLDLAADYIRDQFAAAGLKVDAVGGSAFQPFSMSTGAKLGPVNTLEIVGPAGQKISAAINADFTPQSFGSAGAFFGEIVFCGYAIDAADKNYSDLAGLDLKGKVALVMRKVPRQGVPNGPFTTSRGDITTHGELRTKVINLADRGAAAILFVNDPYTGRHELSQAKQSILKLAESVAEAAVEAESIDAADAEKLAMAKMKLSESVAKYKAGKGHLPTEPADPLMKFGFGGGDAIRELPILHLSRSACDQILKGSIDKTLEQLEATIDQTLQPSSQVLTGWNAGGVVSIERPTAIVKNVIGVVEGVGPLAEESIVVGAHYDHVGRGGTGSLAGGSTEIHNGADDNASGTVSLLELARRIASRPEKLPRRVVFIAFTAEEMGLIGSARYAKEPVFPLENTVAMFNLDMVGRLKDNKLTVYGVETAKQFTEGVKKHGASLGLDLVLKPEGFGPSDHSSFYAKKIPVLHLFTGLHPEYHRPADDWDKINVEGTSRIVDLTEQLIVDTALNPARPEYVEVKGSAQMGGPPGGIDVAQRREPRPYFGSIPDFGSDKPGYALGGVSGGSPAANGGLKAGDHIIQLGPHKVTNLDDFDEALRKFSAGDDVEVTVQRGNDKVVLKVTLEKPRGG